MTDKTDHRAAAEGELLNAIGYVHDADLSKADRAYQCVNFALIHALLAIHDTLAAPDRYAANEAEQQEDAPDPLDEDDHRDRVDSDGDTVRRKGHERWAWPGQLGFNEAAGWPLSSINATDGPLTFAPDAAPDAPRADLTASEAEGEAEDAAFAPEPLGELLCPECGHGIDDHDWDEGYYVIIYCLKCDDCRQAPSDIARHLIAVLSKPERGARR